MPRVGVWAWLFVAAGIALVLRLLVGGEAEVSVSLPARRESSSSLAPREGLLLHVEPEPPPRVVPTCSVSVADAFGGAVEGASLLGDGGRIGETDGSGQISWAERRASLPVTVVGDGYVRRGATVVCPGPTTLVLTPESVLAGLVRARDARAPQADVTVSAGAFETRSDAAGRFVLRGLPPGTYALRARARRWVGAHREPVTLEIGAVRTGLEIELERAYAVDVVVRDHRGAPVPDARLRCAELHGQTDQEGRHSFVGLLPGAYEVELFGSADPRAPSLLHERVRVEVVDRDVEALLSLEERFTLGVEIRDRAGVGVRAVRVDFTQTRRDARSSTSCTTDGTGRCEMAGLAAGEVELRADLPRFNPRREVVTRSASVQIALDDELRSLSGRVVDREGEPVAERAVVARPRRPEVKGALTTSDSRGAFSFEHLAAEAYQLEVHAGAALSARPEEVRDVDLSTRSSADLEIVLASARRKLSGIVLGADGTPAANAVVTMSEYDAHGCWRRGPGPGRAAVADDAGRFEFSEVSESAFSLGAQGRSGELGSLALSDAPGEVTLRLSPTGRVTVGRGDTLRDEECWLRVRGASDCVLAALHWPAGAPARMIDGLPVDQGDLRIELQCGLAAAVERRASVIAGRGVEVTF